MLPFWFSSSLPSILAWWLAVTAAGWLIYPLVFRSLSLLPDRGLGAAKPAGLALLAFFAAWFAHIFRLDAGSVLGPHTAFVSGVCALAALTLLCRRRLWRELGAFLSAHWRMAVFYEVAFFGAFLGFLWFRSHVPDATFDALGFAGAEKWGNLSYLTALWRNPAIPPPDPWLSGITANYYYFSHWVWAAVARLSGVAPSVAFNLALGTLFAALVCLSFSTGWALSERKTGGWLAVFLLAFAGPLAAWSQIFGEHGLLAASASGWMEALGKFNFWAPSDLLPYTRNEFPAFNWLLGDLHAHAMGLLLLLLAVCLIAQLQRAREVEASNWRETAWGQRPTSGLLLVVMAAMWMTNSWDLAVVALFGIGWILAGSLHEMHWPGAAAAQGLLLWLLGGILAVSVLAGFYTFSISLPLDTTHHAALARLPSPLNALGAAGWVPAPERSPFRAWLLFWGLFLGGFACAWIPGVFAALVSLCRQALRRPRFGFNSPLTAMVIAAALVAVQTRHFLRSPTQAGLFLMLLLAVCGTVFLLLHKRFRLSAPVQWAFLLGGAAILCVLVPEFFFLDDPIGPPYQRYNTVFKLYYPAWALAALSLAIVLADVLEKRGGRRFWAALACAWLIAAGGAYPILGIAGRIAEGKRRLAGLIEDGMDPAAARNACRTLDGLAFMSLPQYSEDDLRLGLWMRDHLPAIGRVAETSGPSYTMAGRFAAISGIPSFLGWEQHQFQWRGASFAPEWALRTAALETLYASNSATETLTVWREHCLNWIAVGSLERARYPAASLEKFDRLGRLVQRFGDSALYEMIPDGKEADVSSSRENAGDSRPSD